MVEFVSALAQHGRGGARHFRADAVSRQQHDGLFHGVPLNSCESLGEIAYAADVASAAIGPAPRRITSCAMATMSRMRTDFDWSASAVTRRYTSASSASDASYPKSFNVVRSALRPECFPKTSDREGTPTVSGEIISYVSGFLMMPS